MSIQDNINNITQHFNNFSSWEEKYKELISLGKQLNSMPKEFITDKNKVKGCQSQVWLYPNVNSKINNLNFYADSDALIAKGLVALVLKVYNNCSADEIMQTEPQFIEAIGLREHLSRNRSNGLVAMIKQIKLFAYVLKVKAGS